jgi:hypothetical protein
VQTESGPSFDNAINGEKDEERRCRTNVLRLRVDIVLLCSVLICTPEIMK